MRIIISILALFPISLLGQMNYAPINTVWNYEMQSLDCEGHHVQYKSEKTIIIQSKDCSVIYAYESTDLEPELIKSSDSLIVWENEGRIYFLEDTNFYLLYDFTVEIGDTVTYYDPVNRGLFSSSYNTDSTTGPNQLQLKIKDIEIKEFDTEELKVFNTEDIGDTLCTVHGSIIENVGSTSAGLTGEQCFAVAAGCFGGLQCYKCESVEFNIPITSPFVVINPNCDLTDATKEIVEENFISIHPNPVSEFIHIDTKIQIESINIINCTGQLIKTFTQSSLIDIAAFHPGIYYLIFISKNNSYCKRVIKI